METQTEATIDAAIKNLDQGNVGEVLDLNQGTTPVTAEEIEKHLIEQARKEFENAKPEDVATRFFEMYYPLFKGYLSGLSNKDARRLADHLVQYPLKDQNPKFNDDKAREAFQIGQRLLEAKRIMANVVHLENMQEQLDAKQKAAAEAVEGEQNGKVE